MSVSFNIASCSTCFDIKNKTSFIWKLKIIIICWYYIGNFCNIKFSVLSSFDSSNICRSLCLFSYQLRPSAQPDHYDTLYKRTFTIGMTFSVFISCIYCSLSFKIVAILVEFFKFFKYSRTVGAIKLQHVLDKREDHSSSIFGETIFCRLLSSWTRETAWPSLTDWLDVALLMSVRAIAYLLQYWCAIIFFDNGLG